MQSTKVPEKLFLSVITSASLHALVLLAWTPAPIAPENPASVPVIRVLLRQPPTRNQASLEKEPGQPQTGHRPNHASSGGNLPLAEAKLLGGVDNSPLTAPGADIARGTIRFQFVILPNGAVADAHVLKNEVGTLILEEILARFRAASFQPGEVNGVPVSSVVVIEVTVGGPDGDATEPSPTHKPMPGYHDGAQ